MPDALHAAHEGIPEGLDLDGTDKFIVAFSGGKDSLALVLHLLELGVPARKIELWHHDIDGRGPSFMDWPVTPAYCRAVAAHLGVPLLFSWREGGFEAELFKTDARSKPVVFEMPDGTLGRAGGIKGKIGTRQGFPAQSPDLARRWCSASLKIDVMSAAICNQRRLDGLRLVVLTGERAQESANRARYKPLQAHRTDARKRPAMHWLAIHGWSESQVWAIIRRHGIVPHPAYRLGWARLSCRDCIFASKDQMATSRAVFPASFGRVRDAEARFGMTITKGMTVDEKAGRGTPYAAALANPDLVALADSHEWTGPVHVSPDAWEMPAGAFGENAGPS